MLRMEKNIFNSILKKEKNKKHEELFCSRCSEIYKKINSQYDQKIEKMKEKLSKALKTIKKQKKYIIGLESKLDGKEHNFFNKNKPKMNKIDFKLKNKKHLLFDAKENENLVQNEEIINKTNFLEKFAENGETCYKKLNNQVFEQFDIPSAVIVRSRHLHETLRDIKEEKMVKSVKLEENKRERIFTLKLIGTSSRVVKARNEIATTLGTPIRTIRRFLMIPKRFASNLPVNSIEKRCSSDSFHKCVIKVDEGTEDCDVFGGNLAENNLSQIEILGDRDSCDQAETCIAAYLKKELKEPDLILNFPLEWSNFLSTSNANEKILNKSNCESVFGDTSFMFAGNKDSLDKAINFLQKLIRKFNEKEVEEKIEIEERFCSIISQNLIKELVEQSFEAIPEIVKMEKRTLILRKKDNLSFNMFYECVNFVKSVISPKEIIEIDLTRKDMILRNLDLNNKIKVLFLKEISEDENLACIFGTDEKECKKIAKQITEMNDNIEKESFLIKGYQIAALSNNQLKIIEKKCNSLISVKNLINIDKKNEFKNLKVLLFGNKEECFLTKQEIQKNIKRFDKDPPNNIVKVPKPRSVMFNNKNIKKIQFECSVRIDQMKSKKYKDDVLYAHYGLYGTEENRISVERFIERICLINIEPEKRIEIDSSDAALLEEGIEKIRLDSGCVIFIDSSGAENTIIEVFGNLQAAQRAEKDILSYISTDRAPGRLLVIPESDLKHINSENGKRLAEIEMKVGCKFMIPDLTTRDPLDKNVQISIFGENEKILAMAEEGLRNLSSLLSKVENRITRLVPIPPNVCEKLEQNDSKMLFLIQDETRCVISIDHTDFGPLLHLRGKQITCDAVETRIKQICN